MTIMSPKVALLAAIGPHIPSHMHGEQMSLRKVQQTSQHTLPSDDIVHIARTCEVWHTMLSAAKQG